MGLLDTEVGAQSAGQDAGAAISNPTEMIQQAKSEYKFPTHRRDIHGIGWDHSARFPGRNFNRVEFAVAGKDVKV